MRTVLITGAASGIGRAAAQRFATAGWRCVLLDRNVEALAALLPTLAGPADSHQTLALDLTDTQAVAGLGERVPALDAVVNNAGMSDSSGTPLVEQSPEQQARLVALNLGAPAAVVQAVAPRLVPGARIVNVSSGAGLRAIPWRGMYSPTKAGLIAQSRALAASRPGWCVTVLCPGFVRTELVEGLIAAGRLDPRAAVARVPLARMAEPDEMADALVFLASEAAWPLHGQVLSLDGGTSVFTGGVPYEPMQAAPVPADTPLRLRVTGEGAEGRWHALATPGASGYPAVLDVSALQPGSVWQAVHRAAADFVRQHAQAASLTLLLPDAAPESDWQAAGDLGAARMLVATLACELGPAGLRINALAVPRNAQAATLAPLLNYMAGARAQYLTGQVLDLNPVTTSSHG